MLRYKYIASLVSVYYDFTQCTSLMCWRVLVCSIARNTRFLLTIFKWRCLSNFLNVKDNYYIQNHGLLHVVNPVKWEILHLKVFLDRLSCGNVYCCCALYPLSCPTKISCIQISPIWRPLFPAYYSVPKRTLYPAHIRVSVLAVTLSGWKMASLPLYLDRRIKVVSQWV